MIAERLAAQLLAGERAADAIGVAERLLAVQAQDWRGVRLAVRARSVSRSAADLDRALSDERTVVIAWLNRGTLHLVRSEDYPWLHALTAPGKATGNARRLAQEGVLPGAADRAVDVIERSLADDGPLTRQELGERISALGIRTEGQALVHLLGLASLRGLIVRGPLRDREHAYVLVRDWIGVPPSVDRGRALAELARRYLRGHAPASEHDLATWSGLPLRDARAGLRAITSEVTQRSDGLISLRHQGAAATPPPPRLLGAFDPVLLGWRSREWIVGPHRPHITAGGVFRPFALVAGRAVATWSMPAGTLALHALEPLSAADTAALTADAEDVRQYLNHSRARS
jgi:hypothetical protein